MFQLDIYNRIILTPSGTQLLRTCSSLSRDIIQPYHGNPSTLSNFSGDPLDSSNEFMLYPLAQYTVESLASKTDTLWKYLKWNLIVKKLSNYIL